MQICGAATPIWLGATDVSITNGGANVAPGSADLGWGQMGAVATEAITDGTGITGIQFQCDTGADAMCGLNADHADNSWQDLVRCTPCDSLYWLNRALLCGWPNPE